MTSRTDYRQYQQYFISLSRFYQKKKTKTYAGIIFSILTATFFLFFAIKPTLVTITGLMKQMEDQKLITEKLQDKINDLNVAQREYGLVEPNLYLIDQALPESPQLSVLIKQVEALAYQSGVTVENIQYGQTQLKGKESPTQSKNEESKPEGTSVITFSLAVSGDYQSLKNFLSNLTLIRRTMTIESFAFHADKTGAQTLTLGLKGQAYYLTEGG